MLNYKLSGFSKIQIVSRSYLNTIHTSRFFHKARRNASYTCHTHFHNILRFCAQHSTTDSFCPWQIDNLAELIKVIEFPFPVRTNRKDINIIFLYVVYLLTNIVLDNDLVCQSSSPHSLYTFQDIVAHIQLASVTVEVIVGDTYN